MSITPRVTRRLYERMQLAPDVKRRTPVSKFDGATRAPSVTSEISRSFFSLPLPLSGAVFRSVQLGCVSQVRRPSRTQIRRESSIHFCYKVRRSFRESPRRKNIPVHNEDVGLRMATRGSREREGTQTMHATTGEKNAQSGIDGRVSPTMPSDSRQVAADNFFFSNERKISSGHLFPSRNSPPSPGGSSGSTGPLN